MKKKKQNIIQYVLLTSIHSQINYFDRKFNLVNLSESIYLIALKLTNFAIM